MQVSSKRFRFREDLERFVSERMLLNDPKGNVLDLTRSMVFKNPQPKNLMDFMVSVLDVVEEDIRKNAK